MSKPIYRLQLVLQKINEHGTPEELEATEISEHISRPEAVRLFHALIEQLMPEQYRGRART